MMDNPQESIRKSISEQLSEALGQLSTDQLRFVVARQGCSTDKEAAEAIGVKKNTVYSWPDYVKEAVQLVAQNGVIIAQFVLERNISKAVMVKVAGLDSDDEKISQGASTEIIDRVLGKAQQFLDIKSGGERLGNLSHAEQYTAAIASLESLEAEEIPADLESDPGPGSAMETPDEGAD